MSAIWQSSSVCKAYAEYRPAVPDVLLHTLLACTSQHNLAVDLGCGSATTAVQLAATFDLVIGIDPSAEQLRNAPQHCENVVYATGSSTDFSSVLENILRGESAHDVDLLCVGTAMHWFDDIIDFKRRAKSLLNSIDGRLAVWCYFYSVVAESEEATMLIRGFTNEKISYWPAKALHCINHYDELLPQLCDDSDGSGMQIVDSGIHDSTVTFGSVSSFLLYLRTWSGIIAWVSTGDTAEQELAAFQLNLEKTLGTDVPFRLVTPHHWWILSGEKTLP